MDDENKKSLLPDADLKVISKAAEVLMMDALFATDGNATYAIGALSLALAAASVLAKVPLDIVLQTMAMHYTNQTAALLATPGEELPEEAFNKPVPPKTDKDLN